MNPRAPSLLRILVAAGFALSCFGLLLFLWIAFGGPIPLQPTSYRFTADFPEATTLAEESDVRVSGVTVGSVKELELPPDGNATRATIEIDPEFAPIAEDVRAIVREKTLLGESYIELTPNPELEDPEAAPVSLGAQGAATDAQASRAEPIPEGGHLAAGQVRDATQIDDIFNALDEQTRESFQRWQANAAIAIDGRGLDLNDSLGNLGPFIGDASDVVDVLHEQRRSLKGLVHDTGEVFAALTERDQELAGAITGSNATFGALADQERALAETFQVLPTFERELRSTLVRLDRFRDNTHPLVRDLIPVARDVTPTLRSVRRLSPPLRRLFPDVGELITASRRGLPALRGTLDGLGPVLDQLDPFLANLDPAVRYLSAFRGTLADFLSSPPAATAGSLPLGNEEFEPGFDPPAPVHALRQLSYLSAEGLSVYQQRLPTNRGNGYLQPRALNDKPTARAGIFPNFDCDPSGGERFRDDGGSPPVDEAFAPCFVAPDFGREFGGGRAPRVRQDK
jgi:phospholipid/cholesterol/gamma-HCH transport system substrate-binding protein